MLLLSIVNQSSKCTSRPSIEIWWKRDTSIIIFSKVITPTLVSPCFATLNEFYSVLAGEPSGSKEKLKAKQYFVTYFTQSSPVEIISNRFPLIYKIPLFLTLIIKEIDERIWYYSESEVWLSLLWFIIDNCMTDDWDLKLIAMIKRNWKVTEFFVSEATDETMTPLNAAIWHGD